MLAPGTRLGDRYELREPVARGGMGEVWRADDPVLGRTVAVKVLLPSLSADPGFAERFRTEARAMAALSDPSIVEVYDYGQTDGIAYLVMPFVEGESLHDLLNRVGPLPPREAMSIVAQVANALQQAHRSGIVHRDVKPGNLLVRPDGRLVLTDFGIARSVAAEPVTAAGGIIGTAAYLAPEQVSGSAVAPATDVYALGVVAYECLTMTQPFVADSPVGVALMHTRDDPPAAAGHHPARACNTWSCGRWRRTPGSVGPVRTPWPRLRPTPRANCPRRPGPWSPPPRLGTQPRRRRSRRSRTSHARRGRLWAGLIPIAAGLVLLLAATAIALSSYDVPTGTPIPPANSVAPGQGSVGGAQPADPDQQDTAPGNDGGADRRGDDNSGPGGGGGRGGGGDDGDDNSGPG